MNRILAYLLFCCLFPFTLEAQKVGLVFSGGGAAGFAHIGVIKALEENGIPIDYITGTSAGALIGSMYASGMSPDEMIAYTQSSEFKNMSIGRLPSNIRFLLQRQTDDASLIELPFSFDSLFQKSLPTNFVNSNYMDFMMMQILGQTSADHHKDFNQLFVPFRCVASDIAAQKAVVFSSGNLNEAVRASMTYPFYIHPIRVNGKLLFDGGLYNNFPANVMYHDFQPDYIIGSTVTDNSRPPTEDNLFSQLSNLLKRHSDFTLPCENGVIIRPKTDINTFNFDDIPKAIDSGYRETMRYMDEIKQYVSRRVSAEDLASRRQAFKNSKIPIRFSKVEIESRTKNPYSFISKSLMRTKEKEPLSIEKMEKRYFRIADMEQITSLFPTMTLLPDSTYQLNVRVQPAKHWKLEVGGHFSSRPVNMGYIGLNYYLLRKNAWHFKAESYFGKFYTSARVAINFRPATRYPVIFKPYFIVNRWDYFRSSTSFFENVKPPFLIQNELFGGLKVKIPVGNKAMAIFDFRGVENKDQYYLHDNFNVGDTADYTKFTGFSPSFTIEKNTLNRKQFANKGELISFTARYVNGWELSRPGSTSQQSTTEQIEKQHQWLNFKARYQNYFFSRRIFHLGVDVLGVMNTQSLFSNYKASILSMTAFSPLPDMETLFMEEYRSPQYVGVGINTIFTPFKKFDIRLEAYYYQPFKTIIQNQDGTFNYSKLFKGDRFLASGSIIYNSPVGPVRFTINYFHKSVKPLIFQFSFGYVLFNEHSLR